MKTPKQSSICRVTTEKKRRKGGHRNPNVGRKPQKLTAWLRQRISSLDCGIFIVERAKPKKKHPIHLNTKVELRDFLNKRLDYVVHFSNEMLEKHWAGLDKLYFAANGDPKKPFTLVGIDADAHDFGTVEGCVRFLDKIAKEFGLDLYIEPSPRGAHGYFVVSKLGQGSEYVNMVLKLFQRALRRNVPSDVQGIEIKGTCPVISWDQDGMVTHVKLGSLCTIPQNKEEFDKWRLTARPVEIRTLHTSVSKGVLPGDGRTEPILQARLPKVTGAPITRPEAIAETRRERKTGSCTGCVIGQDELDQLNGHYLDVWRSLVQTHELRAGELLVTEEDGAIFLMLLRFFSKNMNADGSLPWDRWGTRILPDGTKQIGLWDSLKNAGDITRSFDAKRFAVMRNFVSSLGLINWDDETYVEPQFIGEHKIKGRAMKWHASDRLMEMLEWERFGDGREERRTSLAGGGIELFTNSLTQLPESQTIRPVQVLPTPIRWLSPDEIAPYITTFEDQLAA